MTRPGGCLLKQKALESKLYNKERTRQIRGVSRGQPVTMRGKDFGIIVVLVLSIANGRGLVGVMGQEKTGFGKGNFFQDKFCDVFCPKDDSQPRVTLTDEQIQTILDNDEILQMLQHNPDLLYNNEDLDTACLVQLNEDQRDSILAQYGGFFSTTDEAELLTISAHSLNFPDNVELDPKDQAMLDDFVDTNNPGYAESSPTVQDAVNTDTQKSTSNTDNSESLLNDRTSNDGGSSSSSGSSGSSSGSSSGGSSSDSSDSSGSSSTSDWSSRYYSYYSDSSSGSDSRRRRKRRAVGDSIIRDVKREEHRRSPDDKQKLIDEFVQKHSKKKRSMRSQSGSNRAARVKRGGDYIRLCNAETNLEAITLALTIEGVLVQVPQFPESALHQWFVKEKCLEEYSSVKPGVSCNRTSRTEKAVVLYFDGSATKEARIEIESCSAFVSASEAEVAQVVEESPLTEEPTQPPTAAPPTAAPPTPAPTPAPDPPPPPPV